MVLLMMLMSTTTMVIMTLRKPEVLLVGFFSPVNWLSAHAKDKETVKDCICFDEFKTKKEKQDNRPSYHQPTDKDNNNNNNKGLQTIVPPTNRQGSTTLTNNEGHQQQK